MLRPLCGGLGWLLLLLFGPLSAWGQDQDSGVLPTLTEISVVGNRRISEDQILSAFGLEVGRSFEESEVARGIDALYQAFHIRADVHQFSTGTNQVKLRLSVTELPLDLEPRFIGNVKIDDDEILEWAGLVEGQELFLSQGPRIRERLLSRYRAEGFYFAEVKVVTRLAERDEASGDEVTDDVIFEIKEGPRVQVKRVEIKGNKTLPNSSFLFINSGLSQLAQAKLGTRTWFGIFSDDFVMDTLQADLLAMRDVYRDYGFLDAIVELEPLEFSDDRKWVTIRISVDEGGRYTIGSVDLKAYGYVNGPGGSLDRVEEPLAFPKDELLAKLKVKVGDIYERRREKADKLVLSKHYGKSGYLSNPTVNFLHRWNWLEPEFRIEKDRPVIHLTYRLIQGRKVRVREIRIEGNLHTRDSVIRSKINVNPGELADPEKIERSRSRIEGTGFFNDRRDPNHRRPFYRIEDTEDPNYKDIVYAVDEGEVITFNISGGVSSNNGAFAGIRLDINNFDISKLPSSFRNTFSEIASRQAFQGGGQTLSISASPGTEVSQYNVRFSDPDIFNLYRNEISLSLVGSRTLRRYNSHDERRKEVGFTVGRAVGLDSSVFAGYGIGGIEVDDIDDSGEPSLGNPFSVPRDLREQPEELDLAYLRFGYNWRRRDNRLNTRNGFAVNWDNRLYNESYGSDVEFLKSTINLELWNEFDDDPNVVSPYTHLQLGFGIAKPYGVSGEVPYTERFFLGGLRTLRGFRQRGVGPNENGFSNGGQSEMHGTLEYRVPIAKRIQPGTYQETETFQGGIFLDFGILDPDDGELDLDELRASVGLLFGISVPIPITFSFGFPIKEGDDDSKRVFGFNIGI